MLSVDELRAILRNASYHVRLAAAIGGLAAKLRLGNILNLRGDRHFDPAWRYVTVPEGEHKTGRRIGKPLVLPISEQLREILADAQARARRDRIKSPYVVTCRGRPIGELRGALKNACGRAGVSYGRFLEAGVTFHTLRHTAATMLAELGIAEALRRDTVGHEHIATTQLYTHIRPTHLEAPVEQLSAALPIKDAVLLPWRRASNKRADVCTAAEETAGDAPRSRHRIPKKSDEFRNNRQDA